MTWQSVLLGALIGLLLLILPRTVAFGWYSGKYQAEKTKRAQELLKQINQDGEEVR